MALSTYSDSLITTKASEFVIGDIVYVDGDICINIATENTTVKLEAFNSSDVLQATPLNTVHSFPDNINQEIKSHINSDVAPNWDTTGASAGEFYLKLTVSGSLVETSYDYEYFKLTTAAEIAITNQVHNIASPYSISTTDTFTVSANVANQSSDADIYALIQSERYLMRYNSSTGKYEATIGGNQVGACSNETITVCVSDQDDGDKEDCTNPITVNTTGFASYGDQLNLILIDMVSYLTTAIGDNVNIYSAWPQREPESSEYPMIIIQDMGSAGGSEFIGERLNAGEGEWHNMRYQMDILTKRGIFVGTIGDRTLLRKIQIVAEELFRTMDDNLTTIFGSVPVNRVICGDFIDLSFLEVEGIWRAATEIVIVLEHVR